MKFTYCLYDTQDNDLLVAEGTIEEIARYTRNKVNSLYCSIIRKTLVNGRYLIERINDEKERDAPTKKTNY